MGISVQKGKWKRGTLREEGLLCLSCALQQHSGCVGQSSLKSCNHKALSYPWPSDAGYTVRN